MLIINFIIFIIVHYIIYGLLVKADNWVMENLQWFILYQIAKLNIQNGGI